MTKELLKQKHVKICSSCFSTNLIVINSITNGKIWPNIENSSFKISQSWMSQKDTLVFSDKHLNLNSKIIRSFLIL